MLVFVVIQFYGQLPRQFKSSDKAVDGGVLRNAVFCVNDLEHQPALRFAQHPTKCSVALLNFLLLRREFGWGIKTVVSAGSAQPIWVGKKHPI